jgi:GrpB-like predicted nucleotidyltransferase (UPF0157 family)
MMARMESEPIVIVPYDPAWPEMFSAEREVLSRALSRDAVVEHIGSTAVPGLAAKPIIDIMIGVTDLALVEERIADLEALSYEYVPEYEAELPERRYFRKPARHPRSHHLHAVVLGSEFWTRHLAFRDFLRAHPAVASEYAELKLALSSRHRRARSAYTEAKTPFIEAVLRRAL